MAIKSVKVVNTFSIVLDAIHNLPIDEGDSIINGLDLSLFLTTVGLDTVSGTL